MATIYDGAERAELSVATVSAVINHLAHSLQTRVTRKIGMLIPDTASPDSFYEQVVRGSEDVFRNLV